MPGSSIFDPALKMNLLSRLSPVRFGKLVKNGLKANWRGHGSSWGVPVMPTGHRGSSGRYFSKGLICLANAPQPSAASSPAAEDRGSTNRPPRICILGGGFGGLYTAIKLESLMWPEGKKPLVTLIDQNNQFVFKPMLYELLNGQAQDWEIAPSFVDLLEPYPTEFIKGQVTGVQLGGETKDGGSSKGGSVMLEGGSSVDYDWLVLALGAETNTRNIPGVKEHAIPFSTFEDAEKVREALERIEASEKPGNVVVVGGGYAGVELAAVVAERLGKKNGNVTLVTDLNEILASSPELQRAAANEKLAEIGVVVRTGFYVERVKSAGSETHPLEVVLTPASAPGSTRESVPADATLWTAGCKPVTGSDSIQKPIPFPRDRFGAIQTECTLQVIDHTRVFALGDVSTQGSDVPRFPTTAQVAFQQADYVAWNLWASINGKALLSFRYQHLGDMMSLGATSAAVALPFGVPEEISQTPLKSIMDIFGIKMGENSSQKVTVKGPFAGIMRRAAYWYRQPTNEHRAKVGASWLRKGVADASRWVETNTKKT